MKKLVIVLMALVTCCGGCMRGNLVTMGKQNLIAQGNAKGKDQVEIFQITIGSIEKPFDRQFSFSIRLDSGRTIKSDSFSLELIRSLATRTNVISSEERPGCVSYMIGGFAFIYEGDRLVEFSAAEYVLPGGTRLTATLGDARAERFYSLPLTRDQFRTLFGEPECENRRTVL